MPPMPAGFDPAMMANMPPMPAGFDPAMMANMPPMPPNMSIPDAAPSAAPGAFSLTGAAAPPPDPHASIPINTKKKSRAPPSALLANDEWKDEDIVPVRHMTMSMDFGNFDMNDVNSDASSSSSSRSDEEKKSDDVSSPGYTPRKSKIDSPEGSPSNANKSASSPSRFVGGYERKALLKSHLKKPKISVRKLIQYMRWINMLKVWPKTLDLQTIHIDLCNGLLLCRLMAKLVPGTTYTNLHKRPLSRKPAIANIEQALSVMWRGGRVNNSRIPSALDIYSGKTDKITIMISEIFEVYVIRPLCKQAAPSMLLWMNMVLKQYGRSISRTCLSKPYPKLFANFTSGVSLFCLIFHFTGPSQIKHRTGVVTVDPTLIFETPVSVEEYRFNVEYVFKILAALRIETFWTPDEFINFHDTDFLMLQLYKIYSFFVDKRCALPPAQGDAPGVSANERGEPIVTGLYFKQVSDQKDREDNTMSTDVLIGDGRAMTVKAPQVVRDATTIPPHFPPGLVCAATFDVPTMTHEAPIAPAAEEGKDEGILLNADKRRESFFKLNAASHFVVEKKEDQADFFIDTSMNSSFGSDAMNSSFGTAGGDAAAIGEMLEKLSLDRDQGEANLREREFALEKEYTKVEMQANMMPASLFDEKFDQLEEERELLEEEREEFERKFSEREAILRATPIVESPRRESTMRSPMTKKEKMEDEDRKKGMESGWIKATRKSNTQNASIRKQQQESEARIAKSMTRKDGTSFSPFKHQWDAGRPVAGQQFDAFSERMRSAQEQWLSSKEAGEVRAIQILREDRKNRPPMGKPKGGQGNVQDAMSQIRSEELRLMSIEEERRHSQLLEGFRGKINMMKKAEKERTRKAETSAMSANSPRKESVRVGGPDMEKIREQQAKFELMQKEADGENRERKREEMRGREEEEREAELRRVREDAAPTTRGNMDDSQGILDRLQQNYETGGGGGMGEGAYGGMEEDDVNQDVLSWLSATRPLKIKERNSERQFDFRVVSGAEIAPTDAVRSKCYAVMWGNNGSVSGFISLCDIAEIRQSSNDPSSMIVALKGGNPQAVCNSGGLPTVMIRTSSFAECTSYRTGLTNLMSNLK